MAKDELARAAWPQCHELPVGQTHALCPAAKSESLVRFPQRFPSFQTLLARIPFRAGQERMKSLGFPVGIARRTGGALRHGGTFDCMVNRGKAAHQLHGRRARAARKVVRRCGIEPGALQRLEQILSSEPRAMGTESERARLGAFFEALDACADRGRDAGDVEKAQGRRTGCRLRPGGPRSPGEIHGVTALQGHVAAEHHLVRPVTDPFARPVEFPVR